MKTLFLLTILIISSLSYAQEQKERIEKAYIKADQNYELACYYFGPNTFRLITPKENTIRERGLLSRKFQVESAGKTFDFTFKVTASDKSEGQYHFLFNNGLKLEGQIKSRSPLIRSNGKTAFYLPTKRIDRHFRTFAAQHELYKISCKVAFAMEKKLVISDKENNLHVNVHPHDKYDPQGVTIAQAEDYYQDPNYKSYVLLEEGNFKGNLVDLSDFLEMKEYHLVKNYFPMSIKIPESVELKVSPAGHNRYSFLAQNDVQVIYTGGNHNYCMWNNTREILTGYMRSHSEAQITLVYDTEAIVVQAGGLVGLNFNSASLKEDNLLSRVFARDPEQAQEYTEKYFKYFADVFVGPFRGLFKSVTLVNESRYGNYSRVIKGQGQRKLKITLKYKNL